MFKHITLLLFITTLLVFDGWATTYYSQGSVAPNLTSSWYSVRAGGVGGSAPTNFTSGDIFVIQNGHNMTTSSTWPISGANSKLWIENGGTLTATSAITLATATTFQIDDGGLYVHDNTTAASTSIYAGTEVFGLNSTIKINKWINNTTILTTGLVVHVDLAGTSYFFGNLEINWTANTFNWQQNYSGTVNFCAKNLTVTSVGSGQLRLSASGAIVKIGGNYSQASGIVNLASSSGTGDLRVNGNFTLSGGTITRTGTGLITFTKSGTQIFTCTSGGISGSAISVTINSGSTLSLSSGLNMASSSTLTVNGTLDCGTNAVTGAGAFTLASGATLKMGSPDGLSNVASTGNIQVSGTRTFNSGAIYEYNGGSAQVTGPSLPTTISGTLKINNSSGVTATNGVIVSGILDLSSGLFNLNGKSFTFSGTVTGSGTLTGTSLTDVTISGTGAFGTLNFTSGSRVLGALTLNRTSSGTVTLGSDLLIDVGDLTLTSGHLSLGANTLTIASGSDILTPSSLSFIVTNGAGSLKWTIPDATSKIFPVGFSSANYNPVTLTNPTSKEFSVRAKSGTSNPVVSTAHLPVFWDITPTGVDNLNATVKLQWNGSQESGQVGFDRASNLELARWTGAPLGWVTKTATLTGADPYTAEATGFTSFSEFGVSTNGALPVELVSFTASSKGTTVTLNWETKTEVDNNGFEVERNVSGNWDKIGFVEGHGTAHSPKYYSFVDNGAIGNKIQYRLKQIDNDGTFEYSPEVEVELNPTTFALYQNYPNPFNPSTIIRFSMPVNGNVALNVFNTLGEKVATLLSGQMEAGYHEVSFDAQNLPSGLYFYEIKAGDFSSIKKMILIK